MKLKMATVREIQNLLKKINITIDKDDVMDTIITLENTNDFHKEGEIKEFLLKNAQYIDFKKLLVIIVKRRQELTNMYKQQKISPLLERESEQELEKAIKFAKSYIKPEEFIKVQAIDYEDRNNPISRILDSKTIVYDQRLEKKNELYEKIKDKLPDLEFPKFLELLNIILEDEKLGNKQFLEQTDKFIRDEGVKNEERKKFWEQLPKAKSTEEMQKISQIIDQEKFNKYMKSQLENLGVYINAEKCLLYYACCVGTKLEKRRKNNGKRMYIFRKSRRIFKRYQSKYKN